MTEPSEALKSYLDQDEWNIVMDFAERQIADLYGRAFEELAQGGEVAAQARDKLLAGKAIERFIELLMEAGGKKRSGESIFRFICPPKPQEVRPDTEDSLPVPKV